jgi:RHS repeat-associated protein
LTAVAGTSKVTLTWTGSAGATGYTVKYGTVANGPYPSTAPFASSPAVVTGLTNGTKYYFVVVATNSSGSSGASNEANATPIAVPLGLAATPGNAQVSLAWSSAAGAVAYNVKRSANSGGPYTTIASGVTATNFIDTGLTNGATYFYVVSGTNTVGESDNSSQVSATPSGPASAPTGLTAVSSTSRITLTWTASSGATGYNIKRGTSSGSYPDLVATGVAGTTYLNPGLVNGTKYYYVVTASGVGGESANSNEASATPIAVPGNVTVVPGDGYAHLSWNTAAGATSYRVKYGTTPGGPYPNVAQASDPDFYQYGLTNGTTYYFVVTGINYSGESDNSSQVSTVPVGPVPAPPTGLAAVGKTSRVDLTWVSSSGATGYKVKYGTAIGGPYPNVLTASGTSATVSSLTNGTKYYFVVTATNASGESGNSNEANATPIAIPSGLTATPGNAQVVLNWSAAAGATSYNVKYGTVSGTYPNSVAAPGTTSTITGLTNGTTYYFVVTGVNTVGEGDPSSEVSASPQSPPTPPAAPTGLAAVAGTSKATLTWNPSSGATSYTVKYGTVPGTYPNSVTATSPAVVTGLTNGTKYYFVVVASNTAGSSGNSSEASATPIAIPAGLTPTAGDAQVTLSWSAAAGATSYKVKYGTTSGGSYPNVVVASGTTSTITGLTNGTTYYFIVTGVNTVGESDPSSQVSSTPQSAPTPPAAPTGVAAVGGTSKATLTWSPSAGATSYTVRYGITSGSYPNSQNLTSPAIVTGLTNGTKYYFVVVANNATGSSGNSSEVNATPIAVPAGLTISPSGNQATLNWTAAIGATAYNVKRSTASGGPYTTIASNVTATTYLDTLPNGTNYYYVVSGTNTVGESDNSLEVVRPRSGLMVPIDIVPNPPFGILPDALTLPDWLEGTVPTDQSGGPGGGPASIFSISLPHGVVDVNSGPDLVIDNPTGPSVSFERRYRTALAAGNLSSPGLARGWTHNWDYRIVPLQSNAWGTLKLVYPNGASETLTPALDGSGNPTGAFASPTGAPYVASGIPGSNFTWTSITLKQNGLSNQSFTIPLGDTVYRLSQEVSSNGRGVNLTYTSGKLTGLNNGGFGMSLTLLYGEAGGLLSQATDNATGNARTYYYDGSGTLTKILSLTGSGFEWIYGYTTLNGAPYLNSSTTSDPQGTSRNAVITYDAGTGRASLLTDAKGGVRSYSYDDAGSAIVNIAGAAGASDNYKVGFDATKRQLSETNAAGDTTYFQYGGVNPSVVTHVTPPLGGAIDLQTDSHGNPTRVTHPYGNYQTFLWEYPTDAPLGRISSTTDFAAGGLAGGTTVYSYYANGDPDGKRGLLQTVSGPDGSLNLTYSSLGSLKTVSGSRSIIFGYTYTDPLGNFVGERYGKPTSVSEGGQPASNIRYDVAGRVATAQDPLGNISTPSYNVYDQLTALQLPLQKTLQIGYAVAGKASTTSAIVDGGISRTLSQQIYDQESGLRSVTDGNNLTTGLTLDGKFDLSAVANAANRTMHQFLPDPVNRATQTFFGTGAQALTLTYASNGNGDVVSGTGSDGRTATFARSSVDPGLVTRAKYQDGSGSRIWNYFTYDSFGRLQKADVYPASSFDPGQFDLPQFTHVYSYDVADRVTSVQTALNGPVERSYLYNTDGTRAAMYVAFSGFSLAPVAARYVLYEYTYDSSKRLTDIAALYADASKNVIAGTTLAWANYTYDANGRITAVRTPKAITLYAYDQLGRLTAMQNLTPDGYADPNAPAGVQVIDPVNGNTHTILSSFTNLSYDILGNRTGMQYSAMSSFGSGVPGFISGSASWGYDSAGRLTSEAWTGATSFSSSYGYDAGGNLTSLRGIGLPVDPLTDQLSGYSYNSSGDLTAGFTYDPAGRVKTVAGTSTYSPSESYVLTPRYDEDGHRYVQDLATFSPGLSSASSTAYVYDGDALVQRYWTASSGLNPTSDLSTTDGHVFYLWGPTGVAMEFDLSGHSRAFTYDPQGNTVATADVRAAQPMFLDAYGKPIIFYVNDDRGRQQPFQYKGQFGYVLDQYSGLYYCLNRYYSPAIGRWTQRDPVGLEGGTNVYAYVEGNPIMSADPSGLLVSARLLLYGRVVGTRLAFAAILSAAQFGWWAGGKIDEKFGLSEELGEFYGGGFDAQNSANADPNYLVLKRLWNAASPQQRANLENQYSFLARFGAMRRAHGTVEVHHLLPQEFESWFRRQGIQNINDKRFLIPLARGSHKNLHGKGGMPSWNAVWREFQIIYPNATPKQILRQLQHMRKNFGV